MKANRVKWKDSNTYNFSLNAFYKNHKRDTKQFPPSNKIAEEFPSKPQVFERKEIHEYTTLDHSKRSLLADAMNITDSIDVSDFSNVTETSEVTKVSNLSIFSNVVNTCDNCKFPHSTDEIFVVPTEDTIDTSTLNNSSVWVEIINFENPRYYIDDLVKKEKRKKRFDCC